MIGQNELVIDNFAGGGGASTGIERALGRPINYAINHDAEALAMHAANHPRTVHLCESVWAVDIAALVAGRPVGLCWFSPDCCHFSKAKGGKPVKKSIRGLAWVALKWAGVAKPRIIILENVEEFQTWGPVVDGQPCPRRKGMTFKRWIAQLRNLGYTVAWRELRACDYGAPTIRKRLFIVARRDGAPIIWPEQSHAPEGDLFYEPYRTAADCINWDLPCPSIFMPPSEAKVLRIKRPLADATLRRIARGVMRYVVTAADPFIVSLTHQGENRAGENIREPFRTLTGAHRGEKALVVPCLAGLGGRMGQSTERPVDAPYHTVTAKADTALVTPFISRFNMNGLGHEMKEPFDTVMAGAPRFALVAPHIERQFGASGGSAADEPLGTTTAGGGGKSALVATFLSSYYGAKTPTDARGSDMAAPVATQTTENRHALVASHLTKLYGTCQDGQPINEPLGTVSAQGTHHAEVRALLMSHYGTDQSPELRGPMPTVTSRDRLALVMVKGQPYVITDIGMRMLSPRELFRAQGFPDSYLIEHGVNLHTGESLSLSKTAQVRMCGNSVSPPVAEAVVRAQFETRADVAAA